MDAIDRKILAEIQQDGRISLTELSERVGLSVSPCQRRLRTLESDQVISGYRATIDAAAVGLNFSAIVFATLREGSSENVQSFEDALIDIPEITPPMGSSNSSTCGRLNSPRQDERIMRRIPQ
ncbi:Lrp/AsnC family transcriptional regulator [Paraburkholderia guartelaensis]|uniref:Lrp/AsnC family transcriptional regulator n=1 Tax=Paraburkholderia guartelaensis TaxID=2546446 RepID=A0A4R5LCV9_9BURK|nr:Lrp/AsnC family transcriptional regulator [Paraburkholderia guartelaensis]TDG05929.1 Lrp/AsnC family transcriptional regulator [Paraburkholderia guartelaensis]